MSEEFEDLKPLSFEDDTDTFNTLPFENLNEEPVQLMGSLNKVKNKDSTFVFFFGTSESGKSVILSSMLYYLKSQAGDLRPKKGTLNTTEAEVLLSDFFENISQGILPSRTTRDQVTRLDLVFEPNNRSKKIQPINLTFLETAGENHNEIRRGGSYHSSIESYLNDNITENFGIAPPCNLVNQEIINLSLISNNINKGKENNYKKYQLIVNEIKKNLENI